MENRIDASTIILKTLAKTLAILIVLLLIVVLLFGLIAPMSLSDLTYQMGIKGISVRYAATAYSRSKDINDLATVIDRSIASQDFAITVKYIDIMLLDKYYDDFCDFQNANTSSLDSEFDYDTYIKKNYLKSLVQSGETERAIDVLPKFLVVSSGKIKDVFSGFSTSVLKVSDAQFTEVDSLVKNKMSEITDDKSRKILCADMYTFCMNTGRTADSIFWQEQFDNH